MQHNLNRFAGRSIFTLRNAAILAGAAWGVAKIVERQFLPRRIDFTNRVVVITGGSRGLGLELARCFVGEGAKLAICARSHEQLQRAVRELEARGATVIGEVCDVTSPAQIVRFIQTVVTRFGRIDVLVNNAGLIQVGPLTTMRDDDFREGLDTHFWGPLKMIQKALPHMTAPDARIVNIASIGGEVAVPHMLPYSVSKFALVALSQGMHTELADQGVTVTTVCPGLMRTGSPRNAQFKGQHRKEFAWFTIGDSMPAASINSHRAAKQIVAACRRGQPYLAISLPAKLAIRLNSLLPNISAQVLRLMNRFLPSYGGIGTESRQGKESQSDWAPSRLTWLTDRAAEQNNELDP